MKKAIVLFVISVTLVNNVLTHDFDPAYINKILSEGSKTNENLVDSQNREFQTRASFNCPAFGPSPSKPTSVHALRPGDIDIVSAVGDSLTAANGAKATYITGLLEECRGVSWSMGGENSDIQRSITFPNILRQFSPNLYGFSTGSGKANSAAAFLNIANPGDTSYDMLPQAKTLVARMQDTPTIDFKNSWKIVNFFIGGNDLCKTCKDALKYSPENYVKNIRDTLDYLQANLPRTLVNLVNTLNVGGIKVLTGITCRNMQNTFCDCGTSDSFAPRLNEIVNNYQVGLENLINSGRYDNSDTFTVVLHSFMKKMTPPLKNDGKPDYGLFAPDCFHFSVKGHEAAATELWNSMLTPVGRKPELWNLDQPIKCPSSAAPYIYTNKNSRTSLKDILTRMEQSYFNKV